MKKNLIHRFLLPIFAFIGLFIVSCNDLEELDPDHGNPTEATTRKIYILSEGQFNSNNSSLASYNFAETDSLKRLNPYFFRTVNNRGLGDTALDMQRYGNKIYIVVNVSSQIEVIDAETGISIRRIPMFNENNIARQPRYIDFHNGKAYICSFDGTVAKLDTTSLQIEGFANVGRNPDGICIANNKIYVSNSGGLSYPNYDNTVSVVDITSFKEIKKIEVGLNPFKLHADSHGDVYVLTRGNYSDVGAQFHKIDTKIDEKVFTFDGLEVSNFEIHKDKAYMYNFDYLTGKSWIKVMDCVEEKIINNQFIKDENMVINSLYSISINPINEDVYVTDANNFNLEGDVLCFNKNGDFKFRINEVGLNPNRVLFFD